MHLIGRCGASTYLLFYHPDSLWSSVFSQSISLLYSSHGCTIKDNVLVGMGSIIMDDCIIESNSIIAAGAVVIKGTHVPEGTVFAGMPAKKIKDISPELSAGEVDRIANNYVKYSSWFKTEG